jgi:hypothetical protein
LGSNTSPYGFEADTAQQLGYDPSWYVPNTPPAPESSPMLAANAAVNTSDGQTASDATQSSDLLW